MRRDAMMGIAVACAAAVSPAIGHAADAPKVPDALQAPAGENGLPRSTLFPALVAPVAGADPLLTASGVDLLTAAITTKTNGSEFRASSVPMNAFDVKYVPVVSDATVVVSTDTSTSLTRAVLSLPYNPFSLRSKRVARIIQSATTAASCGLLYDEELRACTKRCDALGGGKTDDVTKKLKETCAAQCRRDRDRALGECNTRRLASEWHDINDSWVPLVALTGSADFYPYGSAVSTSDPTVTSPLRWWGGTTLQASATLRKWERAQGDLWGTYRPRWRASGAPDATMARYAGGGVSASYVFKSFLRGDHLERYADYAKTGVFPGLALGASAQGNWCVDGDARCSSGRTRQLSLTPFLDVRISSQLLLRLAVPLNWYRSLAKDGTEAAPTFTLAGAFGAPG